MTNEEKQEQLKITLGDSSIDDKIVDTYLRIAGQKILNRRFPFDKVSRSGEVPTEYEWLQIELACVLINRRGAEGESTHSENGVNISLRSETEIMTEIIPLVGVL